MPCSHHFQFSARLPGGEKLCICGKNEREKCFLKVYVCEDFPRETEMTKKGRQGEKTRKSFHEPP